MRTLNRLISLTLLLILAMSSPGWARMVTFEAAAPLADGSDTSIELALRGAVDTCVRGATAMGLSWIWLRRVAVAGDQLVVQMIATDEDDEDGEDADTPSAPDAARAEPALSRAEPAL